MNVPESMAYWVPRRTLIDISLGGLFHVAKTEGRRYAIGFTCQAAGVSLDIAQDQFALAPNLAWRVPQTDVIWFHMPKYGGLVQGDWYVNAGASFGNTLVVQEMLWNG